MNFVALLIKLINDLRRGNKILIGEAGFAVLLGLGLIVLSVLRGKDGGTDWFTLGGGIFANALAGFPLIQLLNRMERITAYTEILMCFEDCAQKPPECREQCEKFAEKVMEEAGKR